MTWTQCDTVDLDLTQDSLELNIPESLLSNARDLLSETLKDLTGALRIIGDVARLRTAGRFQWEMSQLSKILEVSWRDLMIANISYDLILSLFGCSTIVFATALGPVVARNLDWFPERLLARGTCCLKVRSKTGASFQSAAWPGSTGIVTGLSSRGFAVVLNAVSGPKFHKLGYPVLLHLRRVIEEAIDFDDALQQLSKTPLTSPCLLTLVGSDNSQRVVIERSPKSHFLRWAEGEQPLITTNHYFGIECGATGQGEIYDTTCRRYDALEILSSEFTSKQEVDDKSCLEILTDRDVVQSITAQHVIMRPRQNSMKVYVPSHFLGA